MVLMGHFHEIQVEIGIENHIIHNVIFVLILTMRVNNLDE